MDQSDRSAFIPGKLEFTFLFLISAIGLLLLNFRQVTSRLLGEGGAEFISTETLPSIQRYLLDLLSVITADVATFIFWLVIAFIGIVILDVIRWLFQLYLRGVSHKNLANTNVYKQSKIETVIHFMLRSVALIGLIAWIACLFLGALPLSSAFFVSGFTAGVEAYKIFVACIGLGLYIYLGGIFLKFLTLRRHLFS